MAKKNPLGEQIGNAVRQSKSTEDIIKENIVILPELQRHIPPLSAEEFAQLEQNIVEEGCRDAIVLWIVKIENEAKYVLIDGHNRYKICQHHQKDFQIRVLEFADISYVKNWMINNQLGKRNVTEEVKSYLRGQQYTQQKDHSNFKGNQFTNAPKEGEEDEKDKPKQKTHERLAEQHRVSPKTIQRDEKYSMGLDRLAGQDQQLKWKILQRDIVIPKSYLENIAEKSEQEIEQLRVYLKAHQAFPTDMPKEGEPKPEVITKQTPALEAPKEEPKELQTWDKWEVELLQAFKKLKKKRNSEELERIKSVVAQIEQEMKQ